MKIKSIFGPDYKEYEVGEIVCLAKNNPLRLVNGSDISNFPIAYQTYGKLNEDKSNAILICHALTGDQYVASTNPISKKDGWWKFMIGDGLAIDTGKYFVICSNVLGGCMGSFGPKSINQENNLPFETDFPTITITDMVNAQKLLIDHFGIKKLHGVIGGSLGGMQVLTWSVLFPSMSDRFISIASSYRHSPQNIAFHEVGRQAIMSDEGWCDGKYLVNKRYPTKGLSVARMTAHITYLSETALQRKFGRNLQNSDFFSFEIAPEFQVESYLHYQGSNFVERFDPNSYLYITKAADYFDLERDNDDSLIKAFAPLKNNKGAKFCIISYTDDWLFPPSEAKKIIHSLIINGVNVSSIIIDSDAGHDSFLIENDYLKKIVKGFIENYE